MRKITSHYCLTPDGRWAKRPIIELDDFDKIIGFREMGDSFVEEPNLEYFPGVIIPSLIMTMRSDSVNNSLINRSIIEGARRFIVDKEIKLPASVRSFVKNNIKTDNVKTPWQIIKENINTGIDLASSILDQTLKISEHYQLDHLWGAIKVKAEPGLILLQGVDLKDFKLTSNVTMKVLVE
ncbi:hypothetical protein [Carboxylicivirga caseinilyticus]|uniref:hypothetical protein n=1 Tax=Carboxylicivirga caseinilyticus TaxID=3417572 RepID=UPI003D32EFD4|nr:hypothetical protein [Marinilabiliaceae bacterium A049]